jgi:hypothetical protein
MKHSPEADQSTAITAGLAGMNLHSTTAADLKLLVPVRTKDVLQDLCTLDKLKSFAIKRGDIRVIHEKEYIYGTLQEVLQDIKSLPTILAERGPIYSTSMQRVCHTQIAELLDQLSDSGRQCLMAGLKMQDVADAWHDAIQDRNYAYLQPDK